MFQGLSSIPSLFLATDAVLLIASGLAKICHGPSNNDEYCSDCTTACPSNCDYTGHASDESDEEADPQCPADRPRSPVNMYIQHW